MDAPGSQTQFRYRARLSFRLRSGVERLRSAVIVAARRLFRGGSVHGWSYRYERGVHFLRRQMSIAFAMSNPARGREYLVMNILYGSQIAAMLPRQPFFGGKISVIRPVPLLDSDTIRRFHRARGLPWTVNPCPSKNAGKRQEIRDILQGLYRKSRKIRGNILNAMHNVNLEYLPRLPGK